MSFEMDTAAMMFETGPKEKICSVCDKTILRPRRLLLDGVVIIYCSTCAKNAPKVPFVGESKDHIVCKECCELFVDPTTMKRHSKSQHSLIKSEFPCSQCGKKYNRKDNLEQHFKRYHGDSDTKQMVAITNKWVLVDQNSAHDEIHFSTESNDSWSSTPNESAPSNVSKENRTGNPRKRSVSFDPVRIDRYEDHAETAEKEKDDGMTSWWSAHAITVKKLPLLDQIELKLAINNIIGQKELEVLKRGY